MAVLATFSVPAQAFYDSTFQILLKRETIREPLVTVASTMIIHAKYDESGTCYVLGASTDYPCTVDYSNSTGYAFVLSMTGEMFQRFIATELAWDQPSFMPEFMDLFSTYAKLNFQLFGRDFRDSTPSYLSLRPLTIKNSDGKTAYTLQ